MGRIRNYSNTGLLSYGFFSRDGVIADTLTQADPDGGTTTLRPAGMTSATVVCACTVHAGGGASLRMILQGSNDDGANWHTISQTSDAEAIGAQGDVRTLGAEGSSSVDLGRWENIRVIADEIASGGNWTITTTLSGFAYPCSGGQDATALASGLTVAVNGAAFGRRGGTRHATVAVRTISRTLGAGTVVSAVLQGSADGGTTWDSISDVMNVTAVGSVVVTQNGSTLIDMGGFSNLRFRSTDNNVTSYSLSAVLSSDGCDWMVEGGSGSELPANAVVNFQWDAPPSAASPQVITGRMLDLNGAPIALARTFKFTLANVAGSGDLDLSTNGGFTGVTAGTAVSATGAAVKQIVATTTDAGLVTLQVTNGVNGTNFISASVDGIPKPNLLVLAQAGEATLSFP